MILDKITNIIYPYAIRTSTGNIIPSDFILYSNRSGLRKSHISISNRGNSHTKLLNDYFEYSKVKVFPELLIPNDDKLIFVDYYFPEFDVILEIDGGDHYWTGRPEDDEHRTRYLEYLVFQVLRINVWPLSPSKFLDKFFDEVLPYIMSSDKVDKIHDLSNICSSCLTETDVIDCKRKIFLEENLVFIDYLKSKNLFNNDTIEISRFKVYRLYNYTDQTHYSEFRHNLISNFKLLLNKTLLLPIEDLSDKINRVKPLDLYFGNILPKLTDSTLPDINLTMSRIELTYITKIPTNMSKSVNKYIETLRSYGIFINLVKHDEYYINRLNNYKENEKGFNTN